MPIYGVWVVCVTTLTQNCQPCSTSKLWMDLFLCLRPVLLPGNNLSFNIKIFYDENLLFFIQGGEVFESCQQSSNACSERATTVWSEVSERCARIYILHPECFVAITFDIIACILITSRADILYFVARTFDIPNLYNNFLKVEDL